MRPSLFQLSTFVLAGCATAPPGPTPRPRPSALAACALDPAGTVRCREGGRLAVLPLTFTARQLVTRAGGGAYVLGAAGELARVDRRGRLNAVFDTAFVAIVSTNAYLCGRAAGGTVACVRDHHVDERCPDNELDAFFSVPELAGRALRVAPDGALCGADGAGDTRCTRPRARCNTLCLAYPSCGALRCADPCLTADGEAETMAAGTSPKIFSSSRHAAETLRMCSP